MALHHRGHRRDHKVWGYSREVRKLEAKLGQPLFHRINRNLQPTQAGEALYRAVDAAFELIDSGYHECSGMPIDAERMA